MSFFMENSKEIRGGNPLIVNILAEDLGNGFRKSTDDGVIVEVEPSVYALYRDTVKLSKQQSAPNTISVDGGRKIYIGEDAVKSRQPLKSALGDSDVDRYTSQEYKELLYGFIGKRYKQDVKIKNLVLGLPNNHYEHGAEELVKMVQGSRKIVNVYGKDILVEIENCEILPQSTAVYVYLYSQEIIDEEARVIINDGGFMTVDSSEVDSFEVITQKGQSLGLKYAYAEIKDYLESRYRGLEVSTLEIEKILQKGLRFGGKRIHVKEKPQIATILDNHFDTYYNWIIDMYRNLDQYHFVVWAGGMAQAHKSRIESKELGNSLILSDAQQAIVKGLYYYGEA